MFKPVVVHLAARNRRSVLLGLLAAILLGIMGRHRAVFLPLSISSTIRLDPILPLAFVIAGGSLITPRRYTLEPRNWRERGVRLLSVGAFAVLASLGMLAISPPPGGGFLLLARNFVALLGLLLLLGAVAETRLALLALGVVALVYAATGSHHGGEPKQWAWLLQQEPAGRGWMLAVMLLVAGLVVDAAR